MSASSLQLQGPKGASKLWIAWRDAFGDLGGWKFLICFLKRVWGSFFFFSFYFGEVLFLEHILKKTFFGP